MTLLRYDHPVPATSPYDMYCPIAKALDVLGERWTLLIIRDLAVGDQRFTDLRRRISGIPPNVLSNRLKLLVDQGVVATRELPPPAARTVYSLTPRGREALPVLRALARWGFPAMDPAGPDSEIPPETVTMLSFAPYFDRAAAAGVDERYLLRIDGHDVWLTSVPGGRAQPSDDPDLVLEGPAWAFVAPRQRTATFADLVADGTIRRVKGSAKAQRSFERVFSLT